MKKFFNMQLLAMVLSLFYGAAICSVSGLNKNVFDYYERLFPLSSYGQAVEICMRVLTDHMHQYDKETATDLCVGRLLRLSDAVIQIEQMHAAKKQYPSEDIVYIIGLMGVVQKERREALEMSKTASSMVCAIESRLTKLLHYP